MMKLGDICSFQSGGTPSRSNSKYFNGTIPWITTVALTGGVIDENSAVEFISDDAIRQSAAKIVKPYSIMVGTRVGVGKVAINSVAMSTSQDVVSLIDIDETKWNKMFLVKFIQAKNNFLNSQARGATIKGIKIEVLAELELPDIDLPTQRWIADTLDKVSEGIEVCRKMLGELDLMVKAKFGEMFGDAKVNPFDWVQSTIGASCTLKSGTSLPLEKENEGGNIPYVKVGDMNYVGNEKYITTSSRFVTEETAGVGIFPVGSVVFPKRGGAIGTNKKRLTSVPICADLNVMGVIPGKQLLPQYLLAYFDTIDLGLLNNGSSVPQINNKDIAPLIISIPPIELQEQFATFVSKIDKSRLTIQQVLSKMELERKVLMQKYFG